MIVFSNKVKNILILFIFLFIVVNLLVTYIIPYLILKTYADDYFQYSKQCHIVKSENAKISLEKNNSFLSESNIRYLKKSYKSSLIECYEKEKLHVSLLNYGISAHSLDKISLRASIEANTSLSYIIDEL